MPPETVRTISECAMRVLYWKIAPKFAGSDIGEVEVCRAGTMKQDKSRKQVAIES